MKKEIINFYKDKGIPISLMIEKRRHNTTPEQVEEAAVKTYEEIQNGLKIEDRETPRYIFRKSIGLKGDLYKKDRIKILNYDKKVRLLATKCREQKHELSRLKSLPIVKELKRLKVFAIVQSVSILIYLILRILRVVP